jgi:hypothetical protein
MEHEITKRNPDELLLQQAGVATLPKPSRYDLRYFQEWLAGPIRGKLLLKESDCNWTHSNDLFALRRRVESDSISK